MKDTVKPNGTRITEKLEDERISAINRAFKLGQKDRTLTERELKNVIADLYAKDKGAAVFSEDNRKLLEAYWEAEYADRQNIDPRSARNDLTRAIEAIGPLSLYSAKREDLQRTIDRRYKGQRQRRVVARLNQFLRFIRREIKLRRAPKEHKAPRHLTALELKSVLKHLEDPSLRAFFEVCFASGCRLGEAFGLTKQDLRRDVLFVDKQLDRFGVLRHTKTRRARQAFVLPGYDESFSAWFSTNSDKKAALRNLKLSEVFKTACRRAFPDDKTKWCTVHDLRHSYALFLLAKKVSLSLVANSLGNSISVCQEYYTGFSLFDDGIQAIRQTIAG